MKKYLFTIFVLLVMLFTLVGTVSAAPNASGTISLIGASYVPSVGPVFKFSVDGKLSKSQLKGSLQVSGGADYKLSCGQPDRQTVRCTAPKHIQNVNVIVTLGGSTFWTFVPPDRGFCYGIYDWTENEDDWVKWGTHCQDDKAGYGDYFVWNNPYWGSSVYVYLPESPQCTFYVTGNGYYYPFCP